MHMWHAAVFLPAPPKTYKKRQLNNSPLASVGILTGILLARTGPKVKCVSWIGFFGFPYRNVQQAAACYPKTPEPWHAKP